MPSQRYFLFAGGALLTLLLTANWLVPVPVSNELTKSDVNLPPHPYSLRTEGTSRGSN
jgi:hypothetical protein